MTAPKPRRRTIRFAIVAVVCLLLGAVTTVGVAWWCMFPQPSRGRQSSENGAAAARFAWPSWIQGTRPVPNEHWLETSFGFRAEGIRRVDSDESNSFWSPQPGDFGAVTEASGWPALALWRGDDTAAWASWWPRDGNIQPGWQFRERPKGVIVVYKDRDPAWPEPLTRAKLEDGYEWGASRLPTEILLPGFALDTALYAAAWYLLIFTPLPLIRAGRRRFRVSRGMCGSCGYDLNASTNRPCPECGA